MNIFENLTTEGLEEATDRLGGPTLFDTDVYTGIVKLAYAGKSAGGAHSLTVLLDLDGTEYKEVLYVTDKKGNNWFPNKQDPKKKEQMMGFIVADDLALLTTGFPLANQTFEDKVVNIYDYEVKREVPTNVPVIVDMIGKEVSVAIERATENKQAKDSSGVYQNTTETRDTNNIMKVYHADTGRTVSEFKGQVNDPVHRDGWLARFKGKTRNKVKSVEGSSGLPGGAAKPTGSLFGGGATKSAGAASGLFGNKP